MRYTKREGLLRGVTFEFFLNLRKQPYTCFNLLCSLLGSATVTHSLEFVLPTSCISLIINHHSSDTVQIIYLSPRRWHCSKELLCMRETSHERKRTLSCQNSVYDYLSSLLLFLLNIVALFFILFFAKYSIDNPISDVSNILTFCYIRIRQELNLLTYIKA